MKILICDDQPDRPEEAKAYIEESGVPGVEVDTMHSKQLEDALRGVFQRAARCIDNVLDYAVADQNPFDNYDVVAFDNNLAHLQMGARLTAESVIGYVRGFTNASYFLSLNKNPDVDFDLQDLVGDHGSTADLALNSEHLGNLGLWTGRPIDAQAHFLPWYWPQLVATAERRRQQVAFIEQHLEDSVFASLGLPTDAESLAYLSLQAKSRLFQDSDHLTNGTAGPSALPERAFLEIFASDVRTIAATKDRDALMKGVNTTAVRSVIARAVAARLDMWFRRDVVGPQDFLVDLPHLVVRMPFLLGPRASSAQEWNATVTAAATPYGIEGAVFGRHLAPAQYGNPMWVSRPAFLWPQLRNDDGLSELLLAASPEGWPSLVFCEDSSTFEPVDQAGQMGPTAFTANFDGSWPQRYVARLPDVKYAPSVRFAM